LREKQRAKSCLYSAKTGSIEKPVNINKYTDIAHSVGVNRLVAAKIWKKIFSVHSFPSEKHSGGNPSHLSYGDLCLIEALNERNLRLIMTKFWIWRFTVWDVTKSGEFTLKKRQYQSKHIICIF
jgi:hypothetical protein